MSRVSWKLERAGGSARGRAPSMSSTRIVARTELARGASGEIVAAALRVTDIEKKRSEEGAADVAAFGSRMKAMGHGAAAGEIDL